ncbi:unnamed protein product [Trifolium pratense]|uniref:Uncharacterized protein n=1 Tax=Trifolium pratense TaxID=57577 RepID=A0ACB0KFW7_TRIPR|nr:unnamed protein product [Trifolium pratense]
MEKNNGKTCGICGKWFSSGKAIGGHMRSHMVKLPVHPKLEINNQALQNSANLTQHSIQSASLLTCHPKKEQIQNFQSMKRSFSALSLNTNRENESESKLTNPAIKRSKCHHKHNAAVDTKVLPDQTSSICETETPEGVSICENETIEGAWVVWGFYKDAHKREAVKTQKIKENYKMKAKDDEGSSDDSLVQAHLRASSKCGRCGKVFRSYQALGGHKVYCKSDNNSDCMDQKPFQCQYCDRVFKSAQALGGHKRVHFSSANEFRGV